MKTLTTLKTLLDRHRAGPRGPGPGPDQAQVRACLRDLRGLSHGGAVGGRRNQEAHRRPLRDPGLPGLAAGQGNRHQPGPDAGHRRHHLHRPGLRRAHAAGDGDRRRALHVPRFRPLEEALRQQRSAARPDGRLLQEGRQQAGRRHLLRRAPHHRQQGDQQARGHGRPQAARARCAAVHDVPARRSAPTRRRSPSPRSTWRCRARPSTRRRTRCRPSRPRSSTKCSRTST